MQVCWILECRYIRCQNSYWYAFHIECQNELHPRFGISYHTALIWIVQREGSCNDHIWYHKCLIFLLLECTLTNYLHYGEYMPEMHSYSVYPNEYIPKLHSKWMPSNHTYMIYILMNIYSQVYTRYQQLNKLIIKDKFPIPLLKIFEMNCMGHDGLPNSIYIPDIIKFGCTRRRLQKSPSKLITGTTNFW